MPNRHKLGKAGPGVGGSNLISFYRYDLYPVKLVIEAGDLVLWDSRSIHCNCPPTSPSSDPNAKNRLKRLVAYVCIITRVVVEIRRKFH